MSTLVGSEFLKLRTTRGWIGYVLALVILSGIGAAAQVGTALEFERDSPEFRLDLLSSSVTAGLIAFLVGITSVTVEFRHGTITRTLLVTPRRERVVVAKELAGFLLGAALAVLAIAVVLAVAIPYLSAEGAAFELDSGVAARIGRLVLAAALWGALGVAVGALLQKQTVAVVVAILWIFLGEGLIGALLGLADLEDVADFLPGQALGALDGSVEDRFSPALGGALALAWVTVLGALGYLRVRRRDIT